MDTDNLVLIGLNVHVYNVLALYLHSFKQIGTFLWPYFSTVGRLINIINLLAKARGAMEGLYI